MKQNKKEECINVLGIVQNLTNEQENNYYDCMYHLKALLTILKHTADTLPFVNEGVESIEECVDTLQYVYNEIDKYISEISCLIEGK